jgi:hypothetical protein
VGQPGLPHARGAHHGDDLTAFGVDDALERGFEQPELPCSPDQRRVESTTPSGRLGDHLHQAPGGDCHGLAAQLQRPHPLGPHGLVHQAVGVLADEDLVRLGQLFEAGGGVDGIAEDERRCSSRLRRQYLAGVDAGTDRHGDTPRRRELLVELGQPFAHLGGRPDGAQRIVLVRQRDAEDRHHRVPDELRDRPFVALHDELHLGEVARQHVSQRLGIEGLAQARGSGDVREQDRHDLPGLSPGRAFGHRAIVSELSRA